MGTPPPLFYELLKNPQTEIKKKILPEKVKRIPLVIRTPQIRHPLEFKGAP